MKLFLNNTQRHITLRTVNNYIIKLDFSYALAITLAIINIETPTHPPKRPYVVNCSNFKL